MNKTHHAPAAVNPISPTQPVVDQRPPYIANPFLLIFDAFKRAFKINQSAAIIVLLGSFAISTVAQILLGGINSDSNTSSLGNNSNFVFDTGAHILQSAGIAIYVLIVIALYSVATNLYITFCAYIATKTFEGIALKPSTGFLFAKKYFWRVATLGVIQAAVYCSFILPAIVAAITVIAHIRGSASSATNVVLAVSIITAILSLIFCSWYTLRYSLAIYAVVDEDLGPINALKSSAALTKSRLLEVWGVLTAAALIPVVTNVMSVFGMGQLYGQLKSYRTSNTPLPKAHALSWILPLVSVAISIVLLAVAGLVAVILFNVIKNSPAPIRDNYFAPSSSSVYDGPNVSE